LGLIVALLLWTHDHRLRKQRGRLRATYQLGEEILSASSTDTILKRITEAFPGILGSPGSSYTSITAAPRL